MDGAVGQDRALSGRYQIERELGRGGMGVVYLARDVRHKSRLVAIKFLPSELAGAVGAARFELEIQTLAGLTHPHILPLHDSGEADGELYYVMPCVEGESLRERLDREGPLGVRVALQIARQVADALAYAHARGVVHRDIKPENILLDRHGHAYVSDFGIARVLDARSPGSSLTSVALRIGSPAYMSPEQVAGERELDGRSDVYSLGCVLFEMLAGEPPFAADTPAAVMRSHLVEPAPSLRRHRADVPVEVDALVNSALAKDPTRRAADSATLREQLDERIVRASGSSGRMPFRRPGSRTLVGLIVVGVSSAALVTHNARDGREVSFSARSIAVLPFEDHSEAGQASALARGLTEDLIDELRRARALRVISSAGVAPFAGVSVGLDSIARALGVGTIITGSLVRAGDQLRATARIIDARTGITQATARVERGWTDVLSLRDSLVADVAFELRRELGRDVRLDGLRSRATSPDAWHAVQQARLTAHRYRDVQAAGDLVAAEEIVHDADSLLARARSLDPHWLDPLVERGWLAHERAIAKAGSPEAALALLDLGLTLADSALRADPLDPQALALRGAIRLFRINFIPSSPGATAEARRDLEAAVSRDSSLARAWSALSVALQAEGRNAEAAWAAARAYEEDAYLRNFDEVLYRLFMTEYSLAHDIEARAWCDELGRRRPAEVGSTLCALTLAALESTDVEAAWLTRDAGLSRAGAARVAIEPLFDMLVAIVVAHAGLSDSARAVAQRARARAPYDQGLAVYEAEMLVALGEHDAAITTLRDLRASMPEFVDAVPWTRRFPELRSRSDFEELLNPIHAGREAAARTD